MENKKKYVYYMQPSMADEMESMLGEANATSKSDFINIIFDIIRPATID